MRIRNINISQSVIFSWLALLLLVCFFFQEAYSETKGKHAWLDVKIESQQEAADINESLDLEIFYDKDLTIEHLYIYNNENDSYYTQFSDTMFYIKSPGYNFKGKDITVWKRYIAGGSNWVVNPFFDLITLDRDIDTIIKVNIPDSIVFDFDLYDEEIIEYSIDVESQSGIVNYTRIDEDTLKVTTQFNWTISYGYSEDTIINRLHRVNARLNPNIDSIANTDLWLTEYAIEDIVFQDINGTISGYQPKQNTKSILNFGFAACPPCIHLKPVLDSIHKSGDYDVQYLSVDKPTSERISDDLYYYDDYDFSFNFGYIEKSLFLSILLQTPPMPFSIVFDESGEIDRIILGYKDGYYLDKLNAE